MCIGSILGEGIIPHNIGEGVSPIKFFFFLGLLKFGKGLSGSRQAYEAMAEAASIQ
jgi:hypothetical protein